MKKNPKIYSHTVLQKEQNKITVAIVDDSINYGSIETELKHDIQDAQRSVGQSIVVLNNGFDEDLQPYNQLLEKLRTAGIVNVSWRFMAWQSWWVI